MSISQQAPRCTRILRLYPFTGTTSIKTLSRSVSTASPPTARPPLTSFADHIMVAPILADGAKVEMIHGEKTFGLPHETAD